MRSTRTSLPFLALVVSVAISSLLTGCSGHSPSQSAGNPLLPPPQPSLTTITIAPSGPTVDVGTTTQFFATGSYSDGSTKDLPSSVTWSSASSSVAAISGSGLALAAGGGTSTISATSGSVTGTAFIQVAPPTFITLTPPFPAVSLGGSQQFTATGSFADGTTHDITRVAEWTVMTTPGTVTLSNTGVAVGNAKGVNWICATSGTVTGSTYLNVTDKTFGNASLFGSYAFTLTSFPTASPNFEAGSFQADGNGNILSGSEDINAAAVSGGVALTGTYSIYPDGRGTVTLTGNGQTRTFRIVLSSNSANAGDNNGQLLETDLAGNAIGTLEKQDMSAFSNSQMAGSSFVFRLGGAGVLGVNRSALGVLAMDSEGLTASGVQDLNDNGNLTSDSPITESNSSVDPVTGRMLATVGSSHFAMYMVSAAKINVIQTDSSLPALGVAEKQTATAPSDGGYAFQVESGGTQGRAWMMGQFDLAGASVTGGGETQAIAVPITVTGGSMAQGSNGRGVLLHNTDHGFRNFVAYVVSPQKMYLVLNNDPHAASGVAELQQGSGAFSLASLSGDYSFAAAQTGQTNLTLLGQFAADGQGNIFGVEDLSQPGKSNSAPLGATYTVSPSGQGTITVAAPSSIQTFIFYLVSPGKLLVWGNPNPDANGIALAQ